MTIIELEGSKKLGELARQQAGVCYAIYGKNIVKTINYLINKNKRLNK